MLRPTRTGTYYAHDFFKLSTPLDLLRFSPLPFPDRLRLGLLALRARRVKEWRALEDRTAANWLREMGGERVYRVVWEPLLRGKFGDLAEEVAAVWFWNKLKLRGGSRGSGGGERLAYYRGGFAALAAALALQLPADRHRPHYAKVKVKVRRHADGALSVWHGPRRLAKHGPKGEPAADGELAAAAQRHAERSAPDPAAAGLCASGCGRCAPFARGAKPD